MGFTQPAAWAWAALAIPIIALYVLKIRLRRLPVSTNLFWEQVFEEKKPRAFWRRLRHLLSLLMQLAFLGLIVAALTDPVLDWGVLEARKVVLVVDNSASMQTRGENGTRFEEALERAEALIDDLRFNDSMAIVAGGTEPVVHCGMTNHQRTLREALADVRASDGPTRVEDAVTLARRIIAREDDAEIVVLTDGCFPPAVELAEADDVTMLVVGEPADNVGITRFQVRRSLVDPVGYEILVELRNFSDQPASCRFDFELDGDVVDVVPVSLAANETWLRIFEKTSTAGGVLSARIDHEDAFPLDHTAVALLPKREPIRVALAGEPNLFLHMVLQSNPLVQLEVAPTVAELSGTQQVTVLHRTVPDPLPAGPVLMIDPTESTSLWTAGDVISNPLVTELDGESELMRHVELQNVFIPEARVLETAPNVESHVLAKSLSEDPLYVEFERAEGTVLALAVNLSQTDLPLRTAFPILVSNAMNVFSGSKGELREALATGDVMRIELDELDLDAIARRQGIASQPEPSGEPANPERGADASSVRRLTVGPELTLSAPAGDARTLRARDGRVTLGPLDRVGLWAIHEPQPPPEEGASDAAPPTDPIVLASERPDDAVLLAVNLGDPAESDLRRAASLVSEAPPAAAGWGGKPLWFYLAVLAFVLSTVEWCLYQRRRVE